MAIVLFDSVKLCGRNKIIEQTQKHFFGSIYENTLFN